MFSIYMKLALALMGGLTLGGAAKTRKQIRKAEVQWVAWKGKYDSVYYAKQKQLQQNK